MKKSLSLLVAIALVFSMFSSMAFAADAALTTEQKYEALVKAGIFEGSDGNQANLDKTMTRAQASKIVALLAGYKAGVAVKDFGYKDLSGAGWAKDYINFASEIGVLEGKGNNKFDPSANVTIEQLATIVVKLLKTAGVVLPAGEAVEGTVSDWAAADVAAVVKAGLIAKQTDYKAGALRALLVDVTYDAQAAIASAGELTLVSVTQTNKGEITASFNKAVTTDEQKALTYTVANGAIKYDVTSKFAEDNKSVVLTSSYLPASEYTVTVGTFAPVKVVVADEKATKIVIGAESLQKAAGQNFAIELHNQFGKAAANPGLNVTVYNATYGKTITGVNGKYDLSSDLVSRVDDQVVVTVTHATGLSATKTFKVVAGSAATVIKLGTVSPLAGKNRISAGEDDIIVPVELTNQYGNKIKLNELTQQALSNQEQNFVIDGITFMLSQKDVVDAYSVNADGNLLIDVKNAATLVINAVNPSTGATGTTMAKIEGAAVVKRLQLDPPTKLVVAGEEVAVPFAAVDNFDAPVAGKDVKLGTGKNVSINSSNVAFANGYPKINGKGELLFKFEEASVTSDVVTAYIYAYVDGAQVGQMQLPVNKKATQVKINGTKNVQTFFGQNASVEFDQDNITFLDSYSRTNTVAANTYEVVSGNTNAVTYANGKLNAVGFGKSEITVNWKTANGGTADTAYKFTVEVVKADDIKTYSIKTIGTIFGGTGANKLAAHSKTVEVVGKLSNNNEVALDQATVVGFVTTSDDTKISVTGTKITGIEEGTSTITAYTSAGVKLAEQVVTSSKAAPVASKVSFSAGEYTGTTVFTVNSGTNKISVQDQYGADIATTGFLLSGDSKVVTASGLTATVVAGATGQATLTYMTQNGASATTILLVN